MRSYIYIILGPIVLVFLWWVFVVVNAMFPVPPVSPLFLSNPFAVLQSFIVSLREGTIWFDTLETLKRVIFGFVLGAVIGIPIGLVIGYFRKVYEALEVVIEFFRSVPAAAIIPFFILVFGVGDFSKIGVAAFSGALIILVNTTYGVHSVKETRLLAARVMKLNKLAIFRSIILPESLPYISAGLRIALSYAMVLVIFMEMLIGTNKGLGRLIIDAQETYKTAEMFVGIIIAGLLGYMLNKILVRVERRVIHWEGKT